MVVENQPNNTLNTPIIVALVIGFTLLACCIVTLFGLMNISWDIAFGEVETPLESQTPTSYNTNDMENIYDLQREEPTNSVAYQKISKKLRFETFSNTESVILFFSGSNAIGLHLPKSISPETEPITTSKGTNYVAIESTVITGRVYRILKVENTRQYCLNYLANIKAQLLNNDIVEEGYMPKSDLNFIAIKYSKDKYSQQTFMSCKLGNSDDVWLIELSGDVDQMINLGRRTSSYPNTAREILRSVRIL